MVNGSSSSAYAFPHPSATLVFFFSFYSFHRVFLAVLTFFYARLLSCLTTVYAELTNTFTLPPKSHLVSSFSEWLFPVLSLLEQAATQYRGNLSQVPPEGKYLNFNSIFEISTLVMTTSLHLWQGHTNKKKSNHKTKTLRRTDCYCPELKGFTSTSIR